MACTWAAYEDTGGANQGGAKNKDQKCEVGSVKENRKIPKC